MRSFLLRLIVHDDSQCNPSELLDEVARLDPSAQIKRGWQSVLDSLEYDSPTRTDVIIDIFNGSAQVAIQRLDDLREIRRRYNYCPTPLYLAISTCNQPAAVRRTIRNAGGHFLYMAHLPEYFRQEMEEIQLELAELKLGLPRWEIVEEGEPPKMRAYVHLHFCARSARVKGSDLESAVLAVMIRNNHVARSVNAWADLLGDDPLFTPCGGVFPVPSPRVLKAYVDRRFIDYIQAACDDVKSGYSAERIIEHIKLGAKAVGYKIRGQIRDKKRDLKGSLGG